MLLYATTFKTHTKNKQGTILMRTHSKKHLSILKHQQSIRSKKIDDFEVQKIKVSAKLR